MSRTCPMWRPEPGRFDLHEECENPSPREDYEHHFGYIDEDQWQWLKEWVARNTPDEGVREKEWDFNECAVLREVTPFDKSFWYHRCDKLQGRKAELRTEYATCPNCGVERPQARGEFPFEWSQYIGEWVKQWEDLSLKEQFEVLRRRGPKWSKADYSQLTHIERHLDRGDLVCRCGMERPQTRAN